MRMLGSASAACFLLMSLAVAASSATAFHNSKPGVNDNLARSAKSSAAGDELSAAPATTAAVAEATLAAARQRRRLQGFVKEANTCTFGEYSCGVNQLVFTNMTAGPTTDFQKLLARSLADQCYPEDAVNTTAKGCPLLSESFLHASLFRNYVYCPGSLLDQAITCLETTTESGCTADAACVWTDRSFAAMTFGDTINVTTTMMLAVDQAITMSVGWLKGPHDEDIVRNYYTDSGIMPFKYCAARWTINETALASLYSGFSGWQQAAMADQNMRRSAAALLGPAGRAITGTCAAGRQLTDWAAICTNATTQEACPGRWDGVYCQWDSSFNACKVTILSVADTLRAQNIDDPWIGTLNRASNACPYTYNATICAAGGTAFSYDTSRLQYFSTVTTSWYVPPPAPPPPPSPGPPTPPSPSPPTGSASALRQGHLTALLLRPLLFALTALLGAALVSEAYY